MHDTQQTPAKGIGHFIGNADEFPILRRLDFFNHAGVCPLPRVGGDALRRYAEQAETVAYVEAGWYRDISALRQSAANLINATKDEIAFVKNTSEGISIVANGVDWRRGDRIVTTNVEYPANIYPWMEVARSRGCELVMVPEESDAEWRRHVPLDRILQAADHPRTRLVALSHVEYASGQRHDLATVGAFCRGRGILFCVDAIQSLGVLPVDVKAMNIDYLSADGHKWLLGPEGAGIFYCRKELLEQTRPATIGWMNVINALDYGNYDYTLRPDAGRYECGTHNVPGLLALKASVDLLMAVGVEAVSTRIRVLGDHLIERLGSRGYGITSPRRGDRWSGIVSFTARNPADHQPIWQRLRTEHNTEIAVREGRLRASAHFYNTEEQIDRLVEHLPLQ
jgi:selenocysteine lyase/cysteine desulfurase